MKKEMKEMRSDLIEEKVVTLMYAWCLDDDRENKETAIHKASKMAEMLKIGTEISMAEFLRQNPMMLNLVNYSLTRYTTKNKISEAQHWEDTELLMNCLMNIFNTIADQLFEQVMKGKNERL